MKSLILAALFAVQIGHAAEPKEVKGCISQATVNRIKKSFVIQLPGRENYCDPKNYYYRTVEALDFIWSLSFDSSKAAPYPYDQNILTTDWITRLWRLAPTMKWGTQCSDGTGAYTQPFTHQTFFCPLGFSWSPDVMDLVDTLLHESRHEEGNSFAHVTCPGGRKNACDPRASYRGAYAVSMETYAKIGVSAMNVSPVLSTNARRMAFIQATDRFVVPAAKELNSQRVVLMRERSNGNLIAFNYRFESPAFSYLPPGRLVQTDDEDFMLVTANPAAQPLSAPVFGIDHEGDGSSDESIHDSLAWKLYVNAPAKERGNLKASANIKGIVHFLKRTATNFELAIWGNTLKLREIDMTRNEQDEWKHVDTDFDVTLPAGSPTSIRTTLDGAENAENVFYITNEQDDLFTLTVKDGAPLLKQIENPFPGIVAISTVEISEEVEAYDRQDRYLRDHSKNKKNPDGLTTPRPEPGHLTYLLNKDGTLNYRTSAGEIKPVEKLKGRKFEFMSPAVFDWPWLPSELSDFSDN